MFGYMLSSIGALVEAIDRQAALSQDKIDEIKEYMRWRRLPRDLVMRLRRYYSYYYNVKTAFDEDAILGSLTPALRLEVAAHTEAHAMHALSHSLASNARADPCIGCVCGTGGQALTQGDHRQDPALCDDALQARSGRIRAAAAGKGVRKARHVKEDTVAVVDSQRVESLAQIDRSEGEDELVVGRLAQPSRH